MNTPRENHAYANARIKEKQRKTALQQGRRKSDKELVRLAREYSQRKDESVFEALDWLIANGLVRHDGSKGCIITADGAIFGELVLKEASNPTCH